LMADLDGEARTIASLRGCTTFDVVL